MAYLHCHTENCNWSQDDFWYYSFKWKDWKQFLTLKWNYRPFGYNPMSILIEDIGEYVKPRRIGMDSYWAKEQRLKTNKIHSWWFIKEGIKRYFRVKKNMVYKTYDEYMLDKKLGYAKCPKCGLSNFDID